MICLSCGDTERHSLVSARTAPVALRCSILSGGRSPFTTMVETFVKVVVLSSGAIIIVVTLGDIFHTLSVQAGQVASVIMYRKPSGRFFAL